VTSSGRAIGQDVPSSAFDPIEDPSVGPPGEREGDPAWVKDGNGGLTGHVTLTPDAGDRLDWVEARVYGRGCTGGWSAGPYSGLESVDVDLSNFGLDGSCQGLVAVELQVDVRDGGDQLVSGHSSGLAYATVNGSSVTRWLDAGTAKASVVREAETVELGYAVDDEDLVGLEVTP